MTVKAQLFTKEQIVEYLDNLPPGGLMDLVKEAAIRTAPRFDYLNENCLLAHYGALARVTAIEMDIPIEPDPTSISTQLIFTAAAMVDLVIERMIEAMEKSK